MRVIVANVKFPKKEKATLLILPAKGASGSYETTLRMEIDSCDTTNQQVRKVAQGLQDPKVS